MKPIDAYEEAYSRWRHDPESFWAEAADGVHWHQKWTKVIDRSRAPFYRWYEGGLLNTCYSAVDRHADGARADQLALIYDSPVTGVIQRFTYRELRDQVARVAGVLRSLGVGKGDRVLIFMPNTPEAVMTMLASARLGAVHSVVFGGFASRELAARIDDARPKVIVWASCGIEPGRIVAYKPLLDGALALASHKPDACVVLQRPAGPAALEPGRDLEWTAAVAGAAPVNECVPVLATDPLYILYTSGTTGKPKGVVHDNGGYAVALTWSMSNIYGAEPGDVYWAASDLGWAVGHSYIVYGPLLGGCTTVLYEGKPVGTPDAGAFWRVIAQHRVKILFTAPTAFRAIKRADPRGEFIGRYDLSAFRTLFLAGERADPATIQWAEERLGVPVIDHWWQTETGWPVCANPIGLAKQPVKYRLRCQADARVFGIGRGRRGSRGQEARDRQHRDQGAAAAWMPADPLEQRRGIRVVVPDRLPGVLQDGRRRLRGRRRLLLDHDAHRRCDQRRRPSACRRARWKKSWPRTLMLRNVRSSAFTIRSRVRCLSGFSC